MILPKFKINTKFHLDSDCQYVSLESGAAVQIESAGNGYLQISATKPIGVKFMGMTVATISKVEIENGAVKDIKMDAPFLVRTQVENEVRKAFAKIPFASFAEKLSELGVSDNWNSEVEINSDKSIAVLSNQDLMIGRPRTAMREFKITSDGNVCGSSLSVDSTIWREFIATLL